jgi:hypothetical protein
MKYHLSSEDKLFLRVGPGKLIWIRGKEKKMDITEIPTEELQKELDKRTWHLSADNQRLVDLVHGLLCSRTHEPPGSCSYYQEAQSDIIWTLPSHKEWLGITLDLFQRLEIAHNQEFLKIYLEVQDVLVKQKALSPKARALMKEISAFND